MSTPFLPKMVALDLDGTLVNSEGSITSRTLATLKKFKHRTGALIVICTGRETSSTKLTFDDLDGCVDFAILTNGAMVRDSTWKEVRRKWIAEDVADRLLERIEGTFNDSAFIDLDFDVLYVDDSPLWLAFMKRCVNLSDHLYQFYESITEVVDGIPALRKELAKRGETARITLGVEGLSDTELIRKLAPLVTAEVEEHGSELTVVPTGLHDGKGTEAAEVLPGGLGKHNALRWLCEEHPETRDRGMTAADVIAFGDSGNDREMLAWAGTGVAVSNADPKTKEHASEVMELSNDEDAVAARLEEIMQQLGASQSAL